MIENLGKGRFDLAEVLKEKLLSRTREDYLGSVDIECEMNVDRKANPKFKRSQRCWEAKGKCLKDWKAIQEALSKVLYQSGQESFCEIGVSFYMVGKKPERARPIIIISSEDKRSREAARKAITTSGILTSTGFDVGVLKYMPTGSIRPLSSSHYSWSLSNTVSSLHRRLKEQLSEDSKDTTSSPTHRSSATNSLLAHYDPRHQARTTGMPIFIRPSENKLRKATANLIHNGSEYRYITAAHVFSPWDHNSRSIDNGEDDIGLPFDSDSDDEDTRDEQISSAKGSIQRSRESIGYQTLDEGNGLLHGPPSRALPGEIDSPSNLALLGHTTAIQDREQSVDCAIITIEDKELYQRLENFKVSEREQTIRTASAELKSSEVTALTTRGPIKGVLNNTPILMKLPGKGSFQSVYAFSYESPIKEGDSGSLVVDRVSRELYGMVIAASDKQDTAYIVGAKGLLEYISKKGWRLLQVDEDYTAANEKRDKLVLNDSSTTPTPHTTASTLRTALSEHPQPEWDMEHQRYLHSHWDPQHGRYYRNHYVEGQGWVFFDWLAPVPRLTASDSPIEQQAARPLFEAEASHASIEGPHIVGTYDFNQPASNSHVEPLDSSYYVRSSSFFVFGKVFSILFSEPSGGAALPTPASSRDSSVVKYGEYLHSQIRRFIVVSTRHGFCYAVPIFTYGEQATKKHGVDPSAHAIAYSLGSSPSLLEGESALVKEPICIMMTQGVPPLSPASRIFFGIHHPIQHNVKVKDIGQVHPHHIHSLLRHWNEQNLSRDY